MTTRQRSIEPRSAQRFTVLAVTSALLVAGVALANTAGGSDKASSMQVIRTERALESVAPTAGTMPSPSPAAEILTPGQTARPLDPSTSPKPAPSPGRVAPTPERTAPDRGGAPGKPKSEAEAPKDRTEGDDNHETVKPPVRDEDDADDSDSDAPKTNDDKSDESERQVQRQGE